MSADPPLPLLAADRSSLTDQVAAALRAAVRSGHLEPGRLYSAHALAERLGVSRSPVREALLQLAGAGLVRFERNRGVRVLVPEAADIAEIFAVRLALEVPAARRAAAAAGPGTHDELDAELAAMRAAAAAGDDAALARHDRRLHGVLLATAGHRRAAAIVDDLRDVTRLVGASTLDGSRTREDVCAEHEPVVAAVRAGDGEAAAAAMAQHLDRTARLLLRQRLGGAVAQADELWRAAAGLS